MLITVYAKKRDGVLKEIMNINQMQLWDLMTTAEDLRKLGYGFVLGNNIGREWIACFEMPRKGSILEIRETYELYAKLPF